MNNHQLETVVERSLLRICLFLGAILALTLFSTIVAMGVEICQPVMSQGQVICDTLILTGMIAFGVSCGALCIVACLGAVLMVLAAHIDEKRAEKEEYIQSWDAYLSRVLGFALMAQAKTEKEEGAVVILEHNGYHTIELYNPFLGEHGTPLPEVSVLDMVDEDEEAERAEFFYLLRVKTPVLPENRACQGIGCGNPDCFNHDSFREEFDPFLGWGHVLQEGERVTTVINPLDEYAPRESAYRHEQEAVYGCIFSEDE